MQKIPGAAERHFVRAAGRFSSGRPAQSPPEITGTKPSHAGSAGKTWRMRPLIFQPLRNLIPRIRPIGLISRTAKMAAGASSTSGVASSLRLDQTGHRPDPATKSAKLSARFDILLWHCRRQLANLAVQ
jgi:hypothetical protein